METIVSLTPSKGEWFWRTLSQRRNSWFMHALRDHKDLVSAKKYKNISWLCRFKDEAFPKTSAHDSKYNLIGQI